MYGYTIIPFALVAISNVFLIIKLIRGSSKNIQRNTEKKAKRRFISISVSVITLAFIVLTGPSSFIQPYIPELLTKPYGNLIIKLLNQLFFIYYGFNFIFLVCVNRLFRDEVKSCLNGLKIVMFRPRFLQSRPTATEQALRLSNGRSYQT